MFNINTVAIKAGDTTWAVYQFDGKVPQRDMLKHPLRPDVTEAPLVLAATATRTIPPVRCKINLDDILYF